VIKKPTKDLKDRIVEAGKDSNTPHDDLMAFCKLLDQCLNMNPEKRITPSEALKHPFITGTIRSQPQVGVKPSAKHGGYTK